MVAFCPLSPGFEIVAMLVSSSGAKRGFLEVGSVQELQGSCSMCGVLGVQHSFEVRGGGDDVVQEDENASCFVVCISPLLLSHCL